MVTRVKFWLPVLALAAALLASGVTPGAARTWREYRTDNFILYSDTSEKRGRQLVEDLEYFRHYLQVFTSVQNTVGPLPLTVVAFSSRRQFNKEFNNDQIAGFYFDRPSGAMAVVGLNNSKRKFAQTGRHVLFHEYVHYYLRQFSPLKYPTWYDEGFAEFLSGFHRKGLQLEFGQILNYRASELFYFPWLPTEKVLSAINEGIANPVFYSQAWFTVHYFQFSEERLAQLRKYIVALNLGRPHRLAFRETFNIEMKDLDEEIHRYWKGRRMMSLTATIPEDQAPEVTVSVRELRKNENLLVLARIHLLHGKSEWGEEKIFKYSSRVLKDAPQNIEALSLQAEAHVLSGRFEEAQSILDTRLTSRTGDDHPQSLILKGKLHLAQARKVERGNPYINHARKAAAYFSKALEFQSDEVELLYLYGLSSTMGQFQNTLKPLKALLKARDLLPQNEEIERAYAVAALRAGYAEQAAEIFQDYLNWAPNNETENWAQKNLDAANAQLGIEIDAGSKETVSNDESDRN